MNIFKQHQIFEQLKKYLPQNPVMIEAGSCDGKDALNLIKAFPTATLHAFEPVPELYSRLVANTTHLPNICTYNVALSDTNGTATFHVAEKTKNPGVPTQAGSLHAPKERLKWSPLEYPRTIKVPTTTLDSWAKKHTVNHVDCRWLDMQGHELHALKGAKKLLKNAHALYVEMNFIQAYELSIKNF